MIEIVLIDNENKRILREREARKQQR